MKLILIAIVASVSAIKIDGVDSYLEHPIPAIPAVAEKPNQYNRVCDNLQPTIASCNEGNTGPYAGFRKGVSDVMTPTSLGM